MSITSRVAFLLVVVGVGFTVWDYSVWRRAEYGKFGQGPAQVAPAQKLASPVQSEWAGVRWSVPVGWNLSLAGAAGGDRAEVAKMQDGQSKITIFMQNYTGNLIGAAEEEVSRRARVALSREREYLNTEFTHAVVLTWEEKDDIIQAALLAEKGKLVIVEAVAPTSAWAALEPTFDAVYRSVILF